MAKKLKKKTQRKKLNPFDVVVILLVLCLIGTIGYRVYRGVADPSFRNDPKYIVAFECYEEEYNSVIKYLENNEAVYFSANGELLGNLYVEKAGEDIVSLITEADNDETVVTDTETTEFEDTSYIYEKVKFAGKLKLNADAIFISGGNYYTVGEMNFNKGSVIEVYTEDAVFTIKVTGISVIQ